ncbi:MAG: twin-arginine translocase TatA/TatE family subunit, partial [Verrucomicrobiota bacterium]|nr:twin-arginine translocase TatA/TatE family subunit [Verrucomicrobiota bacterium]
MFGIGTQELVLILIVALIVLGPRKLPDVARAIGKALREFQRVFRSLDEENEPRRPQDTWDSGPDSPTSPPKGDSEPPAA